jgi:hypothetical protein
MAVLAIAIIDKTLLIKGLTKNKFRILACIDQRNFNRPAV